MHYKELQAAREQLTGPGGPFEIIETDILGNRIRDYKNRPNSVRDIWLGTTQFADRDYIVYEGERITYAEAHRQAASAAGWLFEQGVQTWRPRCHCDAQLSGMDDPVLGLRFGRRRCGRHERLVDRARNGLRDQ